jgi:hypothetical protein
LTVAEHLLAADDIGVLLHIARVDADVECAESALMAVVRLPLDGAAGRAAVALVEDLRAEQGRLSPAVVRRAAANLRFADHMDEHTRGAGVELHPSDPLALADRVRTRMTARRALPADLTARLMALGSLPDDDAQRFLSELLRLVLSFAQDSDAALATVTAGLSNVVDALRAGGSRTVDATLPSGPLTVPARRRAWAGGLLTLVRPAEVVAAVRDQITVTDHRARRTALRRLAAAAAWIGRPPLPLPAPDARRQEFEWLYELLASARAAPRATRGRSPAPSGQPPDVSYTLGLDKGAAKDTVKDTSVAEQPTTRTAYARLDAPDRVAPKEVFELRVGLAVSPTPGVGSAGLAVPTTAFILTVQVLAEGFRLLGDEPLTREIHVAPEDPYPYHVLRLVPRDEAGLKPERVITAVFMVDGRMIGVASRVVIVAAPGTAPDGAPDAAPNPALHAAGAAPAAVPPGVDWVLPADPRTQPDLEIVIAPDDAAGLQLSWFYRSPHPVVGIAPEPVRSRLDERVAEAARQLMRTVEDHVAEADFPEFLGGISAVLGEAVPEEVWAALRATATVSPVPTVLLATWDPYVPWELAAVPEPWDTTSPPYLGAQAVVGRWPYREQHRSPAPPAHLEADSMAVVWGTYEANPLVHAEQEAADLERRYGAVGVEARKRPVLDCLKGTPPADIVHFAVHGTFDYTGTLDGILIVDSTSLSPFSVRGVRTSAARVVFLNACQLGQARRIFGAYAGMAAAFLGIQVGAVIAPLWKVDDSVAREVASGFYEAVLGPGGISPAEYFRRQRAATWSNGRSPDGTRLAYLFYGHPRLRVTWNGQRPRDTGT